MQGPEIIAMLLSRIVTSAGDEVLVPKNVFVSKAVAALGVV